MSRDLFYIFVKVLYRASVGARMPEQFLSLSNLGARILLGTLWVYLATSDPLNGIAMSINRGLSRASLPRFYFIYYLYNYYTSFLALCQEKCSLILKKFLSGPEGAEPALNYLLLSGRSFSRNISNVFIY